MMYVSHFFTLDKGFKREFSSAEPNWGYGEFSKLVFYRTFSRNGENFARTLFRVIEGTMSIRKDWYLKHNISWDEKWWQKLAQEMYVSAFNFHWLPPGRGLWLMGTDFIYNRGSMGLYNCAATKLNNAKDFGWAMDLLMLGCGVGFEPTDRPIVKVHNSGQKDYIIPDSREGWVDSVEYLYNYYTVPGVPKPRFIYDEIRPAGTPIKGFGGLASGPKYLQELHQQIHTFFERDSHDPVLFKTNLINAIGCCVVAGNVRRSAELGKKNIQNKTFRELKNYEKYPERAAIGWMSNNTVSLEKEEDFNFIGDCVENIKKNGEPGFANIINFKYGRLGYKHEVTTYDRADLTNPCGEISLEDKEVDYMPPSLEIAM